LRSTNLGCLGVDPSCSMQPACVRAPCRCRYVTGALKGLVSVYLDCPSADDDDPAAGFIRGHLAVLFGLLMRDSLQNQEQLLGALPGHSSRAKLAQLMEDAQQFRSSYSTDQADMSGQVGPESDTLDSALHVLSQLAEVARH
jgi:hypothetical protein